eukprot:PRCOL_00005513-RA
MSLFRVRERWAAAAAAGEQFACGALCCGALAGVRAGACIASGSLDGMLRVWRPASASALETSSSGEEGATRVEEMLLEVDLGVPVLQLEAGRFVVGADDDTLAVLHPRSLVVYALAPADGGNGAGDAAFYTLTKRYEHRLERSASCFAVGRLGGRGDFDGTVVQSMDGELSVFECDVAAFRRFLPDFLLPGPLVYAQRTDTLVTANSRFEVQGFRYAQLVSADEGQTAVGADANGGDSGIASTKKVTADWSTNVGEGVMELAVGAALPGHADVGDASVVVVLGERTLFFLSDAGAMLAQRRLDYAPLSMALVRCVPAHTGGKSFANVVVGSDTGSVMVYHGGSLCWAAKCDAPPLALGAFDLHARERAAPADGLAGMLYTMDSDGRIVVGALGTRPPETVTQVVEGRELDYEEMDEEHRGLLQAIRESGASESDSGGGGGGGGERAQGGGAPLLQLRAQVFVSYAGVGTIELVTLTVRCGAPLRPCREALELRNVRGGARTPLVVPVGFEVDPAHTARGADGAPPATLAATVVASYEVPGGSAPQVSKVTFSLPLALVAEAVPPVKVAEYKVTIDTNRPPPTLPELFPDVLAVSPAVSGGPVGANVLTLRYASGGEATILVSKNAGRYRVQARTFEAIALVAQELARRLLEHFGGARGADMADPFRIGFSEPLPLQDYFALVDAHYDGRAHVKDGAQALERRAEAARAVQRRLLVRFRDKNPSSLGHLDALLEDTLSRLVQTGTEVEVAQRETASAGARLAAGTRLLLLLMRLKFALSDAEALALEAYLTPEVLDSMEMGWEETTDAALVHLLKTALARGAREAGAAVQALSGLPRDTARLKKHIAVVCERISKHGSLSALLE